jgi:hypothetical protein
VRHPFELLLPWVFSRRLYHPVKWARAMNLSADGRHEEALRLARSMSNEFRQRNDWKVLEIQQLCLLRWNLETIEAVNQFLTKHMLQSPPHENRRYLVQFAQWCGRMAFADMAKDAPLPNAYIAKPDDIHLDLVDRSLKRNFPLAIHSEWRAWSHSISRRR